MNDSIHDSGFSTIEALVAITLIAVAGALMFWVSAVSIRSLSASKASITLAADALSIDSALRSFTGRVRIPWWERQVRVSTEGPLATVPWLDGQRDTELTIVKDDDYLTVYGPEDAEIYRSRAKIESLEVTPIEMDGKTPSGLQFKYVIDGVTLTCVAPFASRALGTQ